MTQTYDQMPMRSIAYQLRSESIHWAFQHAKALTENKVTHDVENQPLAPMSCVPPIAPVFVVRSLS
jgi:hypothetical protein